MCASNRFLFFILINVYLVSGQYPRSPCPDIFSYNGDGEGTYGLISFRLPEPATTIHTIVKFSIKAHVSSGYLGSINPIGNEYNVLKEANQGNPIRYRVTFAVTSPLPVLTELNVNGKTLCSGPEEQLEPGSYVSSIQLKHTLYLQSGSISVNKQGFDSRLPTPQGPKINNGFTFYSENGNFDKDAFNKLVPSLFNRSGIDTSKLFEVFDEKNREKHIFRNPSQPPEYETYPSQPQYPRTTPPAPVRDENRYPVRKPEYTPQPPSTSRPEDIECGVIASGNTRVPLIKRGESFSRGDWPWIAAIYRGKGGNLNYICAGTLISDRHVLSAAHCMVVNKMTLTSHDIVVKLGVHNQDEWGENVITANLDFASVHEEYNFKTIANDIVVFRLSRVISFNDLIRPACLWEGSNDQKKVYGLKGAVAGWGLNEFGDVGRGEPRVVYMPIVTTTECRASGLGFLEATSESTLCAGSRNGAGPCNGDSGGGLYVMQNNRWRVRGVVSTSLRAKNGEATCNLDEYIIFTDAAKYTTWVIEEMARK